MNLSLGRYTNWLSDIVRSVSGPQHLSSWVYFVQEDFSWAVTMQYFMFPPEMVQVASAALVGSSIVILCSLGKVKWRVWIMVDVNGHVRKGGSVSFYVCLCVLCPGLCPCLANLSYACCSNTGLCQPAAHWIWPWMNTFSLCLSCRFHTLSFVPCLSLYKNSPWTECIHQLSCSPPPHSLCSDHKLNSMNSHVYINISL